MLGTGGWGTHPPAETRRQAFPPAPCLAAAGNDFSTLFAPLVRDGRMEKFYWMPTEEDLIGILHQVRV